MEYLINIVHNAPEAIETGLFYQGATSNSLKKFVFFATHILIMVMVKHFSPILANIGIETSHTVLVITFFCVIKLLEYSEATDTSIRDLIHSGKTGEEYYSAVNAFMPVAAALIVFKYGSGNKPFGSKIARILYALIIGVILAFVYWFFVHQFLYVMIMEEEIIDGKRRWEVSKALHKAKQHVSK